MIRLGRRRFPAQVDMAARVFMTVDPGQSPARSPLAGGRTRDFDGMGRATAGFRPWSWSPGRTTDREGRGGRLACSGVSVAPVATVEPKWGAGGRSIRWAGAGVWVEST